MPIHYYKCEHGHRFDYLWFFSDTEDGKKPTEIICEEPNCSAKAYPCGGEIFARTVGNWGDSLSYYDRGLGRTIKNHAHKEQVMKELNVEPINSVMQEENIHKKITEHQEHQRQMSEYQGYLDSGMHTADAIDKTFKLDHTTKINTEINNA